MIAVTPGAFTVDEEFTAPNDGIFNCDPANVIADPRRQADAARVRGQVPHPDRHRPLHGRHLRHRRQRPRPHVHDDGHLQLRPRRHRDARRLRLLAAARLGRADRGLAVALVLLSCSRRRSAPSSTSASCAASKTAQRDGAARRVGRHAGGRPRARHLAVAARRRPPARPVLPRRAASGSSTSTSRWHELLAFVLAVVVAIGLRAAAVPHPDRDHHARRRRRPAARHAQRRPARPVVAAGLGDRLLAGRPRRDPRRRRSRGSPTSR